MLIMLYITQNHTDIYILLQCNSRAWMVHCLNVYINVWEEIESIANIKINYFPSFGLIASRMRRARGFNIQNVGYIFLSVALWDTQFSIDRNSFILFSHSILRKLYLTSLILLKRECAFLSLFLSVCILSF